MLRELDRIEYELADLNQRGALPWIQEPVPPTVAPASPSPVREPDSGAVKVARANTQEMPVIYPEPEPEPEPAAAPDPEEEQTDQP